MRQRFDFVVPSGTPESELARAAHSIARLQKLDNSSHPDELEKTPHEQVAIDLFDDLLKREFLILGIPEVPELRPERFHVMSEAWFSQNREKTTVGSFTAVLDKAVLSRERSVSPVQLYATILHEAIHSVSQLKIRWNGDFDDVQRYRIGYCIKNTYDEDDVHGHFEGFNEGVVELTAQEFFEKQRKEIQTKLNLLESDVADVNFYYPDSRAAVRSICHGLAEADSVNPQVAWDKIKRGQFTGEMMHLRDIERTYGKGALRILDKLNVSHGDPTLVQTDQAEVARKNELIRLYFESYDRGGKSFEIVRSRYAIAILGLEDYKKYCQ